MNFVREFLGECLSAVNWLYVKSAIYLWPVVVFIWGMIQGFYAPVIDMCLYLIAIVAVEIISGIWASKKEGEKFNSHRLWWKKAMVSLLFFLVLTAMLFIDLMLKEFHDGLSPWISKSWILFYGCYEIVSILENAKRSGLHLAGLFISVFKSKLPSEVGEALDKKESKDGPTNNGDNS